MKRKKTVEFQSFIEVYKSLNEIHQQIVFQTLFLMEHGKAHPSMNTLIYNRIRDKSKKLNLRYGELLKKMKSKSGYDIPEKTYESLFYRKTISGDNFKLLCEVLGITNDIREIKIDVMSKDLTNIEWLFNSLSSANKNAMYTLVNLLKIEETDPEYFTLD